MTVGHVRMLRRGLNKMELPMRHAETARSYHSLDAPLLRRTADTLRSSNEPRCRLRNVLLVPRVVYVGVGPTETQRTRKTEKHRLECSGKRMINEPLRNSK